MPSTVSLLVVAPTGDLGCGRSPNGSRCSCHREPFLVLRRAAARYSTPRPGAPPLHKEMVMDRSQTVPRAHARLPIRPLLTAVGPFTDTDGRYYGVQASARPFLERTGVSLRSWRRWPSEGIPWYWADRVAIAFGFHPAEIWGDAWWDLPDPLAAVDSHYRHNPQGSRATVPPPLRREHA